MVSWLRSLGETTRRKRPERRTNLRFKIQLALRLCGKDENGLPFEELTITDDVSVTGFLCACDARLAKDIVVEDYLGGHAGQRIGLARVARKDPSGAPSQKFGFHFIEKKGDWILQ